jgi:signal transduction histidine kinase
MLTMPRGRPLLFYGAVVALLAIGVLFLPGVSPALFRVNAYAPHGYCILWEPGLLWFHVSNDLLIGASYVAIASSLAYLVYKGRRDMPFHWLLLAFGAFIISCGSTHFVEVWTFWQPVYWFSGYLKLITAIASVATALALPPLIPRVLALLDAARVSNQRKQQLEAANAELALLNARLTELDTVKSRMFANVSHELRTPLTLILGPVEQLLERAHPAERASLETVQRNAQLLQRHVDDLLDVARLEAGQLGMKRERVDLSQLAGRTADYFCAAAEARQMRLQLALQPGLLVLGDADQLQRVLVNLLGNALKFTPDGGVIRLALHAADKRLLLEVQDSGPGVPPAQRETIFERFSQGDGGATRRHGGTGLGLAIAREIVALHDGTIAVDTGELGGARFTVALPALLDEPPLPVAEAALPVPHPGSLPLAQSEADRPIELQAGGNDRPLLLLVEDNAELRDFLVATLGADYRLALARDGEEGLARALELRPDVIVSDLMMPGMSGDELVSRLRQQRDLEQTPIMILTARADADLRLRLLRDGAQEYLLKPFIPAELQARLRNLLATGQARRTLQQALANQEQNLATLSVEVARLYRETQAALQLRDEFIAVAAHELRTPVTALLGNAQLLLRRAERGDGIGERDQRAVRAIGALGEQLARLVERLLDSARLEGAQLTMAMEPLDMAELVERTIASLGPALGDHRILLRGAGPLPIRGDQSRLGQLFVNLLSNAAKYSPPDTPITVELGRADNRATVTVSDHGIGIPEADLPHLFDRFFRASNAESSHTGGLGLGLYLAREIVQRHGGTIDVASVEGERSSFTVTLPLTES